MTASTLRQEPLTPIPPVMPAYVLLDGTVSDAGRALASAVFELAQQGYLDIHADRPAEQVKLIRSGKPGAGLSEGQQEMLATVFTELDGAGQELTLSRPAEWPVGPVAMARSRARLVADGHVSAVKPRTVTRVIGAASAVLGVWGLVVVGAITGDGTAVFYTGLVVAVTAVLLWSGLARRWQVRRTGSGRALARPARRIRRRCRGLDGPRQVTGVPATDLAHELLWSSTIGDGLPSVRALRPPPSWWHGPWPDEQGAGLALWRAARTLGRAFTPTPEELAALRDAARRARRDDDEREENELLDPLLWWETVDDLRSLDFSDWGGGDGGGGDGAGGGDGGGGDGGGG